MNLILPETKYFFIDQDQFCFAVKLLRCLHMYFINLAQGRLDIMQISRKDAKAQRGLTSREDVFTTFSALYKGDTTMIEMEWMEIE